MRSKRYILAACFSVLMLGALPTAGGLSLAASTDRVAEPAGTWRIEMRGDFFSIRAENAQRNEILTEIAMLTGAALGGGTALEGRVTLSVTRASLEEVLARLLQNSALVFAYEPGIGRYRIVDIKGFASGGSGGGDGAISTIIDDLSHRYGQAPQKSSDYIPPAQTTAVGEGSPPVDAQGRLLYKPGEILVRFKPDATGEQIRQLHQTIGGETLNWRPRRRLARVKITGARSELEAVRDYLASGLVAHAERHVLRYPMRVPNDPLYDVQWAHQKMASERAWRASTGEPAAVIAVIDTGIDYTHPDIFPSLSVNTAELNGSPAVDDDGNGYIDDLYGWDFADNDADPFDSDPDGHGTHVAGIAAAAGNNGIGLAGVAWNARLMALKVQKDGQSTFDGLAAIDAMDYARRNGARIVNCSYGGAGFSQEEQDTIAALGAEGILVVCAAGNGSPGLDADTHPIYPAAYNLNNIVSVGASTQQDLLASYSYFGATSVDLLAPGSVIRSTIPAEAHITASVRALTTPEIVYPAIGLSYAGVTVTEGITGALVDCGEGYPQEFQGDLSGKLALIRRSAPADAFTFAQKVSNAAAAGAAGVIIYNNRSSAEDPQDTLDTDGGTLGSVGKWLPAVTITKAAGEALLAALPVQATLIHAFTSDSLNYSDKSGTSMAAPQVAGAAALLWSLRSELTPVQVKAALLGGVDIVAAAVGNTVTGGRLNIAGAMDSLCQASPLTADIDCSWHVDLADLIIALQVMAASTPEFCETCFAAGTDPDGDGRVSVADAVNILQRLAGFR